MKRSVSKFLSLVGRARGYGTEGEKEEEQVRMKASSEAVEVFKAMSEEEKEELSYIAGGVEAFGRVLRDVLLRDMAGEN
jgi:hypothetical protein